ncbi:hypothetical protein DSECCO2_598580 [anaerobic digester metagenome]
MTKQELHAALNLHAKIQRLRAQLNDLRQSLGKPPEVRVHGGVGVSTATIAADMSSEVAELERRLEIEQVVIQRHIDKCHLDDIERKLMILRYVKCYPWAQVSIAMGYVDRHLYRLHRDAINKSVNVS